jgi:hydrogenase expression/formation protein HypC|nr:HypC/HybG/HupF family hydrogenase formation chaperone [uncultured Rhodopila sp.]
MCFTVPMRIVSVVGQIACCEARGTRRDVNLALLADEDMAIGDHVLVHAGCALQRITATDARLTLDLLDEIIAALDLAGA